MLKRKQTKSLYGAENYLSHRKFQYLCALEAVKTNKMSVHTANKILYQSLRQETKDLFESIRKRKSESSINRQLKAIYEKFYHRKNSKARVCDNISSQGELEEELSGYASFRHTRSNKKRTSNSHCKTLEFDLKLKLKNQIDFEKKERKSMLYTGQFRFNHSPPVKKLTKYQS